MKTGVDPGVGSGGLVKLLNLNEKHLNKCSDGFKGTIIPQNIGNRVSKELNFKISQGEGGHALDPLEGSAFSRQISQPPLTKSSICPRKMNYYLIIVKHQ